MQPCCGWALGRAPLRKAESNTPLASPVSLPEDTRSAEGRAARSEPITACSAGGSRSLGLLCRPQGNRPAPCRGTTLPPAALFCSTPRCTARLSAGAQRMAPAQHPGSRRRMRHLPRLTLSRLFSFLRCLMESCRASICWRRRGESFTWTGPEPPPVTWPAPTPADGHEGQQRQQAPRAGAGRDGYGSAGHADRLSKGTSVCSVGGSSDGAIPTMRHLPSRSRAEGQDASWPGQHLTPRLRSRPAPGAPGAHFPRTRGCAELWALRGPRPSTAGVTALHPQRCHARHSLPAVPVLTRSAPATSSPAPQAAWHRSRALPSSGTCVLPPVPKPSPVPGPCLGALGRQSPPGMHFWGPGEAGSTGMLGCGTVPLCCSSAVQGEEPEERQEEAELKPRIELGGSHGQRSSGHPRLRPVPTPVP